MGVAKRNWFGAGAGAYACFRPEYSDALGTVLSAAAHDQTLALDVSCGTGQFTRRLATDLDAMIGCDPSAHQISHATPHSRVSHVVAQAERLPAEDGSVGLGTAAHVANWFDLSRATMKRGESSRGGAIALSATA